MASYSSTTASTITAAAPPPPSPAIDITATFQQFAFSLHDPDSPKLTLILHVTLEHSTTPMTIFTRHSFLDPRSARGRHLLRFIHVDATASPSSTPHVLAGDKIDVLDVIPNLAQQHELLTLFPGHTVSIPVTLGPDERGRIACVRNAADFKVGETYGVRVLDGQQQACWWVFYEGDQARVLEQGPFGREGYGVPRSAEIVTVGIREAGGFVVT